MHINNLTIPRGYNEWLSEYVPISCLTGRRMRLGASKKRERRIAGKQKRRCLRTGIDIPLSHVYFGEVHPASPAPLCRPYEASCICSQWPIPSYPRGLGVLALPIAWSPVKQTGELTAQLAAFPPASVSITHGA